MPPFVSPVPWAQARPTLLGLARADLDVGELPWPRLLAHAGPTGLGQARLRPFADDPLPPLLELLALVLPLGADRLTLALPGRAWSLDDPVVPACEQGDLRQPVLLLVSADAHGRRCRLSTELYPVEAAPGPVGAGAAVPARLGDPTPPDQDAEGPVAAALRLLLDEGGRRSGDVGHHQLASQYARVLLLGHEVLLTPVSGRALLRDTVAVP